MCTKTKCVQKSNFLVCIFFKIHNKFELLISQGSARTYLGVVENIMQFCWKYSSSIQQWKNFENRLRFEKVIAKRLVASFLEHSIHSKYKEH